MNWYSIPSIDTIDSPALLLYKERIQQNIVAAIHTVKDVEQLRPHVKTNKIAEVCNMLQQAGIRKFKCATIAEAEMLGIIKAPDVLLAYQPVGPKVQRLLALVQRYPETSFSCLIDHVDAAIYLSSIFAQQNKAIAVFIDLNVGMNRSGVQPSAAMTLYQQVKELPAIRIKGLHAYDGHIHDTDIIVRTQRADAVAEEISAVAVQIEKELNQTLTIVAGGSPTFPLHSQRKMECSPGTFVFWDWGYKHLLPDVPFIYAALVITRVVAVVNATTITTDLGHKSVAAENPLPRVHFLNATEAVSVAQSEEHLVLKVADSSTYKIGDVLYGVPVHICPTVALYDKAIVLENNQPVDTWKVIARNRSITI